MREELKAKRKAYFDDLHDNGRYIITYKWNPVMDDFERIYLSDRRVYTEKDSKM